MVTTLSLYLSFLNTGSSSGSSEPWLASASRGDSACAFMNFGRKWLPFCVVFLLADELPFLATLSEWLCGDTTDILESPCPVLAVLFEETLCLLSCVTFCSLVGLFVSSASFSACKSGWGRGAGPRPCVCPAPCLWRTRFKSSPASVSVLSRAPVLEAGLTGARAGLASPVLPGSNVVPGISASLPIPSRPCGGPCGGLDDFPCALPPLDEARPEGRWYLGREVMTPVFLSENTISSYFSKAWPLFGRPELSASSPYRSLPLSRRANRVVAAWSVGTPGSLAVSACLCPLPFSDMMWRLRPPTSPSLV
mmetsp:Transcript_21988/g.51132  ORF Transcript_21988/g.51132 Transcript_21988/m.51132 type:complete len:308 (-) Transcript_21988:42-965(-)